MEVKIRNYLKEIPNGEYFGSGQLDNNGVEKGNIPFDVKVIIKDESVVLAGLAPDSQRYFDYHHASNDTFDAVNKRELELGAATMTALVFLVDKYGFNSIETKKQLKD